MAKPITPLSEKLRKARERAIRNPETGCLEWPKGAARRGNGYPTISIGGGKARAVHRLICIEVHGPPPPGDMTADHICENINCIEAQHLRWLDRQTNAKRSPNHYSNKTHCPHGHPLDKTAKRNGKPYRFCGTCRASYMQRYHEKMQNRVVYATLYGPPVPNGHHCKIRTHCPQGHPYDEENTRMYRGMRYCRACLKARGDAKTRKAAPVAA